MKHISVLIDDIEHELSSVLFLHQQNPYPGDHRFKLKITFDSSDEAEKFIALHNLRVFDNIHWATVFLHLNGYLSKVGSDKKTSYFLNNVDKLVLESVFIMMYGTCSEIQK